MLSCSDCYVGLPACLDQPLRHPNHYHHAQEYLECERYHNVLRSPDLFYDSAVAVGCPDYCLAIGQVTVVEAEAVRAAEGQALDDPATVGAE